VARPVLSVEKSPGHLLRAMCTLAAAGEHSCGCFLHKPVLVATKAKLNMKDSLLYSLIDHTAFPVSSLACYLSAPDWLLGIPIAAQPVEIRAIGWMSCSGHCQDDVS
jgi:hypothetical protein